MNGRTIVGSHTDMNPSEIRAVIVAAANDPDLISRRFEVARLAAISFKNLGVELDVAGKILGDDRVRGKSPYGNGSDETVAVALLLQIASELVAGCSILVTEERYYAAAALLRQLAEVEYLAWAFANREGDGEKWLRSTRKEREEFFRPARLRKASNGHFRNQDYSYHCEQGGHPVPRAEIFFGAVANETAQLLFSDALGHVGHIWNHIATWAGNNGFADFIDKNAGQLPARHRALIADDPIFKLPPPP